MARFSARRARAGGGGAASPAPQPVARNAISAAARSALKSAIISDSSIETRSGALFAP
jgi:hypothetical protein